MTTEFLSDQKALAEVERLKELLRTVAVSIPAAWKNGRAHERRSYEAMSAFLVEDQRRD